jgi:hypothetical protein
MPSFFVRKVLASMIFAGTETENRKRKKQILGALTKKKTKNDGGANKNIFKVR